jgi:hypothetical protein
MCGLHEGLQTVLLSYNKSEVGRMIHRIRIWLYSKL